MAGPNLAHRINQHADMLRKINIHLKNIDQKLAFLDVKLDHQINATKSGNGTRNLIAAAIIIKILFEGVDWLAKIDMNQLTNLLRTFGG